LVAEGRPWKYLSSAKTWPISSEPTTVPSRVIMLPRAWYGNSTWAIPVIASG